MNLHHIQKEEHFKERCLYCKRQLNDAVWESEWFGYKHYKRTYCDCGRKITISFDFNASFPSVKKNELPKKTSLEGTVTQLDNKTQLRNQISR